MLLTDPFTLGGRNAPSRVLFGPHETNLCHGRAFSSRSVAYYARRAAGGVGVIVTEEASVHPSDWPYERAPLAADCGAGWRAIADAVHPYGTVLVAALGHAGGQGSSAYSQRELWAPSQVPEVNTREVPKSMEPGDIDAVVRGFAEATRTAIAAGCDGVEVNAGQYSLVRQFLSGLTNTRGDDYGTDRLRFAREVLTATRAAAGDAIVGLRLSCDELAPWAGVTPAAAVEIARALAGLYDYLVVVRGSIFTVAATRPDMHVEPGFNRELTATIRAALNGPDSTDSTQGPDGGGVHAVPVILQGSVVDVDMAQAALADGVADAVEMTRAQIADPELVATVRAGRAPRPCILCNQVCQVRDNRNPLVSCVGEPSSGHETTDSPVAGQARVPVAVTVIGGGPAGLEAARVAALRGHHVTLLERAPRLGGALVAASAGAGRSRFTHLTDWLAAECARLGVTIRTGIEAGIEAGLEGNRAADTATGTAAGIEGSTSPAGTALIVAVGGRDGEQPIPVSAPTPEPAPEVSLAGDGPGGPGGPGGPDTAAVVLSARALLTAAAAGVDLLPADGPVVVWDPLGNSTGIAVAERLAAAGRDVTLVSPDLVVGTQLSRTGDLAPANVRLHQAGVKLVKRTRLTRLDGTILYGDDVFADATVEIACAALVTNTAELPVLGPDEIEAAPGAVVGDAIAPRTVYEAVLEGRRAALAVGDGIFRPATKDRANPARGNRGVGR
ncbi:mycofactocin system FadH/OYE family oxidoreductase 1 [Frankia sp. Cas3]|uniref:mycofactocin system FadH/OYE family oxidoreductase 1 n=1 Tax=Frankia sp. Cas3 TaxID=3073926 RepID=UPI002AD27363|nr:mycofactocin system FadH/OYE family oxidoreductase 1 [Frankia sp. Cas3]